jgi:hypothetical protein
MIFFHTLFRLHTCIYPYQWLFFFFFQFCGLYILWSFSFYWSFFLEFALLKKKFPISSKKNCSHSTKIHQEKSLLCTEFLLFFHSGFICYDRQCNFSFSLRAAPIVATGRGEPAPALVHSASWARPLRGCLGRFRDPDFV